MHGLAITLSMSALQKAVRSVCCDDHGLARTSSRQNAILRAHENAQRAFFEAVDAEAVRGVVLAAGACGWQWGVVVPLLADESWTRRMRRRFAEASGASVGHVVSAPGKTTDMDPRIPAARISFEPDGREPFAL